MLVLDEADKLLSQVRIWADAYPLDSIYAQFVAVRI